MLAHRRGEERMKGREGERERREALLGNGDDPRRWFCAQSRGVLVLDWEQALQSRRCLFTFDNVTTSGPGKESPFLTE